jgi:DNA-binding LacI/PurR family transcriptional regulator
LILLGCLGATVAWGQCGQEEGKPVEGKPAVEIFVGTTMLAEYCEVPMTSVNAENHVAGVKAFELLMDRIEGRANGRYRRLVNPAKLFVRKSTQDKENRR